ncbi:hydroxyethylthiazole kinase [Francisella orientalis]|uniref:Hydroxyethylthiazole kinase n=2 Tax=Francisella orientalis TaxID=299583 RepID=A0AAP7C550_9GAMM|nr:hydroxyethylthiazole kinase [Francisella orientalis]AFJ42905.1 hydroxyethylthiazole kinase [Francisella orientalis str. Toba 04]AHB98012.1 hydroxyethylthiazole kinase [Francisella orientalis LADL 07-285A]AKN85137.1 Hydroxyethylthiazole kinase [Francisella orientalis FNO12]AKN86675.1 Hydroxyethylthiazole kinase [Francisella orientalis FNO24]AKN88214.1 Hydroxyethylthiazole kinase [Francisella orientalis]
MIDKMEKALAKVRSKNPLILCLTNFVTVEFVANSLLSISAAPIMSTCEDEIEELVKMASALYINIGTLDHDFIALAKKAIEIAKEHNKPLIFDPVGSSATIIRTETSKFILPFSNFIRGNSSEIISLAGNTHTTYGVEANNTTDEAVSIAKRLSLQNNAVVIVSGSVDFITDGNKSIEVPFGSPLMQMVTGMGCSLTAVIAAFVSVVEDPFESAVIAAHYFAICGEIASKKQQSIGTFKVAFLDQLHDPDFALMRDLYDSRR